MATSVLTQPFIYKGQKFSMSTLLEGRAGYQFERCYIYEADSQDGSNKLRLDYDLGIGGTKETFTNKDYLYIEITYNTEENTSNLTEHFSIPVYSLVDNATRFPIFTIRGVGIGGNQTTTYGLSYYDTEDNAYIDIKAGSVSGTQAKPKITNYYIKPGQIEKYTLTWTNRSTLYVKGTYSLNIQIMGGESWGSSILMDSDKILPLCFNEKITNVKYNYADTFTTTLGSAYPFARRNGSQCYRTFNIEAMIAFESDEMNEFMSWTDNQFAELNLDEYNLARLKQRMYRDAVIDFLHNGKVKLFSSFQEGNMLVRLSNISLTPNPQLDRNIWTFSALATEVAEATQNNYTKYGLPTVSMIEG